AKRPPKPIPVQ
ncbi:hypothetical protein AO48_02901, partial [Mycobacterium tuberculosis M1906]